MKSNKEVEKSIIKRFRKEIYSRFVRAIKDFELIEEGDVICVCISGGKDSFILAKCLQELQKHSKYKFNLKFLVMDPGYNKVNLELIKENASALEIPIVIGISKAEAFSLINSRFTLLYPGSITKNFKLNLYLECFCNS